MYMGWMCVLVSKRKYSEVAEGEVDRFNEICFFHSYMFQGLAASTTWWQ